MQAAGWFPDPAQRHQYRWWSGSEWSEHVSDSGVSSVDPLTPQPDPSQQTGYPQQASYPQTGFPQQTAYPQTGYPQQAGYPQTGVPQQPGYPQQPQNPYADRSSIDHIQSSMYPASQAQPPYQGMGWSPVPAASTTTRPVGVITLVGALAAVVGAFLDWLSSDFGSANGFDVPFSFLYDYKSAVDSSFSVGWIVILLAVSSGASALVRHPMFRLRGRIAGGLLAVVGGVYLFQLSRLADLADVSLTDVVGPGPFVALAGGITVLVAGGR